MKTLIIQRVKIEIMPKRMVNQRRESNLERPRIKTKSVIRNKNKIIKEIMPLKAIYPNKIFFQPVKITF